MSEKKKVVVIGMGYVGFPLACAIAKKGIYDVVGIDVNEVKLQKIRNRIPPIEDKVAEEDIKTVDIIATNDFSHIKDANYIIVCVPTPVDGSYEPDLGPVKTVSRAIKDNLKQGHLVILESTINPGACEEEVLPILEESGLKAGVDFDLAHCPERIDPGNDKWNVYNIPRNVGATSPEGTKKAADFYRSFLDVEVNEMTSLRAAEATKIIENTFRDINIAYVNELAKSFDLMNIDITEVIKGASNKPFAFLPHFPGCGVGGHCIPVDPYYLIKRASKSGFDHVFLKMARQINNSMPEYTVNQLFMSLNELEMPVKNKKIGILGLSYKANVGDLRESPALKIIKLLQPYKPILMLNDPYLEDENLVDLDYILDEADAVIIITNHSQYLNITDWKNVKLVIDGRNCLDKEVIKEKGIMYKGIGRS